MFRWEPRLCNNKGPSVEILQRMVALLAMAVPMLSAQLASSAFMGTLDSPFDCAASLSKASMLSHAKDEP